MAVFSVPRLAGALMALVLGANALQTETMLQLPNGWTRAGPADPSTPIKFNIGLQLGNIDQLDSKLMSISTPGSPDYGQYLEKDEVETLFAPSANSSGAVLTWLKQHNITSAHKDSHWITVHIDVGKANSLLGAEYSSFVDNNGNSKVRTAQFSLPDHITQHVDVIDPTTYLGSVRRNAATVKRGPFPIRATPPDSPPFPLNGLHADDVASPSRTSLSKRQSPASVESHLSNCSAILTPNCIRSAYKINGYRPDAACGSRVGFASFLNESARHSDFANFTSFFNLTSSDFTSVTFNGGLDVETDAFVESDLDSQYLAATSDPLPTTQFIVNHTSCAIPDAHQPLGDNFNEPWLPYYRFLLFLTNAELPQVISQSYDDDEQTVPVNYARRVCYMMGMLGLRGISIITSSGDTGPGDVCLSNDGHNATIFTPQFPAGCPYTTAVGGTQGWPNEVAWSGSGGGFSSYFNAPPYQSSAVKAYLNSGLFANSNQSRYFNVSGRAYPDVSAHSDNPAFAVFFEQQLNSVGGTSASAPVFAGIVGLLNDVRLRTRKPAMGFLNPWLYSIGYQGFTDITEGASTGCGSNYKSEGAALIPGFIHGAGFNATEGWDAATGFGVPNFEKLKELAIRD